MGAIFCRRDDKWKQELEKRLKNEELVTLLAIGAVKYKVLAYLNRRSDIQVFRVETRYLKNRRKGIGLKVVVRKTPQAHGC